MRFATLTAFGSPLVPDVKISMNVSNGSTVRNPAVVRGEPASFPLTGVIAGWTDGLQVLNVGDSARFWIPEELAYQGKPNNPRGMLVFDIELLEILPPAPPSGMGGDPHGGGHGAHDGHGH